MSYIGFISYQDYIMNVYLWILLGILFRLPEIAQKSAQSPVVAGAALESGQV